MKNRDSKHKPARGDYRRFYQAVVAVRSVDECQRFLRDLCTPAELEAMVDRWRAVELLKSGYTYREISEQTGISVTTVGRVARHIEMGNGGYELIYQRTRDKRK
ncbi:MAG: YerC/YecD family TrpR-related protein [Pirellulaceae bacterium]